MSNKITDFLMKYKVFLKNIWIVFFSVFSFVSGVLTITIKSGICIISISLLCSSLIVFMYILWQCIMIKKTGITLKGKSSKIQVIFGDITEISEGIKFIACESSFEKHNLQKIPSKSLQYRCLNEVEENYKLIDVDGTKSKLKYFTVEDRCFFSIGNLNDNTNISIEFIDYVVLIFDICKLILKISKKQTCVFPIIGTSVIINDGRFDSLQRLKIMIEIFKLYPFNKEINLQIVINKEKYNQNNFNLFELY